MPEGVINHLAGEKSPYLLQHASNPVGWYPWGEEALRRAKNDGKPILLSIGYATCHWCHRMAHESFEDGKVADLINKNFIPIKVDREERPDVDSYYMNAVQSMTGSGGWPLTVFLTPDLKVFYGGTYYPPAPRYGMPSFTQVLEFVAKLWKDSKGEVAKEADRISAAIQAAQQIEGGGTPSKDLLDDAFASLAASFDPEYGGFAGTPKFPSPLSLELLLRYHFRTGNELALRTVVKTLESMAAGGIHDHLGGGFHRYSTDKQWLVPHFEKMLYDNALLSLTYLHAYQVTGDQLLADVAKAALGWMLGELEAPDGGFFSAQDADTKEGEGVYYTWTPTEVSSVLGTEAAVFCRAYGVTDNGNFEGGRSILHVGESMEAIASRSGKSVSELGELLARSRRSLYKARLTRPRPATDTKVLTSWNGLAISAFAKACMVLGEIAYSTAAERAADFLLSKCYKDGKLLRRFAGGEAGIQATLEDYAFLGLGLLDLFESTSEARWLEQSIQLATTMQRLFEDKERGGFFTSEGDVPARLMEAYDGPTPSGNSAAAMLLLRLSAITGRDELGRSADKLLRRFQPRMDTELLGHAYMLQSVDVVLNGSREVVVSAKTASAAEPFLRGYRRMYLPDVTSFVLNDENKDALSSLTPLAEGRTPTAKPLAFLCQNFACKLPTNSPVELEAQLGIEGS